MKQIDNRILENVFKCEIEIFLKILYELDIIYFYLFNEK
jgi:hypothetical protein